MRNERNGSWCYSQPMSENSYQPFCGCWGWVCTNGSWRPCWCCRPCCEDISPECPEENGNQIRGRTNIGDVNVNTWVEISQKAEANGGDANGGDGGNGTGGDASAAYAEVEGDGDATAIAGIDMQKEKRQGKSLTNEEMASLKEAIRNNDNLTETQLQTLQSLLDINAAVPIALGGAAAAGGDGAGGDGGNGGAGGAGGSNTQTATVEVDNIIVLINHEEGYPPLALNLNGGAMNVRVNEDGAFVNGQRMEEEQLENGTRVMILRNSETK